MKTKLNSGFAGSYGLALGLAELWNKMQIKKKLKKVLFSRNWFSKQIRFFINIYFI